jgi:hypothetical protein
MASRCMKRMLLTAAEWERSLPYTVYKLITPGNFVGLIDRLVMCPSITNIQLSICFYSFHIYNFEIEKNVPEKKTEKEYVYIAYKFIN